MKKDLKIQIVTFLIYLIISAISVLSLKFVDNIVLSFSIYYILQATFVFILAAYDLTWAFCAYTAFGILLCFVLPFPTSSTFILSAVSNLAAIGAVSLLYKTIKTGSLIAFAGAGLLRYVIAHFGVDLLESTVTISQFDQMNKLFGLSGLVSTFILIALCVLILPCVKLAIKSVDTPTLENCTTDPQITDNTTTDE